MVTQSVGKYLILHPENDVTAVLKFRDWACFLAEHSEADYSHFCLVLSHDLIEYHKTFSRSIWLEYLSCLA